MGPRTHCSKNSQKAKGNQFSTDEKAETHAQRRIRQDQDKAHQIAGACSKGVGEPSQRLELPAVEEVSGSLRHHHLEALAWLQPPILAD